MKMSSAIVVAAILFLTSACATSPEHREAGRDRLDFALIGDMPYDGRQEREFTNLMRDLDAADIAFVVHDGDFWWDGAAWTEAEGGLPPCSNEAFNDRLARAQRSKHPFIYVAGDNEWADCHRAKPRTYDPTERLAKLRQMFFQGNQSLGQNRMSLKRQSEDSRYESYRENARWEFGGVVFVTLHMIGSNNNLGRTPQMDAEYEERNAANIAWMREAFELAKRGGSRAVMIIAQADPYFQNTWPADMQNRYALWAIGLIPPTSRRKTGYDSFITAMEKETLAFGKPVVYVHGDTHIFRIDKPLIGSRSQRIIENFTRVATVGHPDTHWVRATIDPNDPNVFVFRQEFVKENLTVH
jgi:hypothetical protein